MEGIRKEERGDTVVYYLSGKLDISNADQFSCMITEAFSHFDALVVSCKELEYISSAGLRVFLLCYNYAQENKKRFMICCANGMVDEVMEVAGVSQIIAVFDTLEEALL